MNKVSKSIVISTSLKKFFDIITDYEKYPEFIDNMEDVKVVEINGNKKIVEFNLTLIKKIKYVLELEETSPNKVKWHLVSGDFMNENTGSWNLKEIESNKIRATYSLGIGFSTFIPSFIINKVASAQIPTLLSSFKNRAES
jgi:ribosome-associated toxin RatA of RatAB toxin-antitoxin module